MFCYHCTTTELLLGFLQVKPIQHVTEETIDKLAKYVFKNLSDSVVDEFFARNDYQGNTLHIIDITIERMPVVGA